MPYALLCDPHSTLISAIGLQKFQFGTTPGVFIVSKVGEVLEVKACSATETVDIAIETVQQYMANWNAEFTDLKGSSTEESLPSLSDAAIQFIAESVLHPLQTITVFQAFHTIVINCTKKLHDKKLWCLRDVENYMLSEAQKVDTRSFRNGSGFTYASFCYEALDGIQKAADADALRGDELTRPHDQPYTKRYFEDLRTDIAKNRASMNEKGKGEAREENSDFALSVNSGLDAEEAKAAISEKEIENPQHQDSRQTSTITAEYSEPIISNQDQIVTCQNCQAICTRWWWQYENGQEICRNCGKSILL